MNHFGSFSLKIREVRTLKKIWAPNFSVTSTFKKSYDTDEPFLRKYGNREIERQRQGERFNDRKAD